MLLLRVALVLLTPPLLMLRGVGLMPATLEEGFRAVLLLLIEPKV